MKRLSLTCATLVVAAWSAMCAATANSQTATNANSKPEAAPVKQDAKTAKQDAAPAKQDAKTTKPEAAPARQDAKTARPEAKAAKPAAAPGWIVIDDEFFYPLRFEPLRSLDAVRYHYRRNEEKSAANELDKAVSWLKLAAGHALPVTEEKLTKAAGELKSLAKDLRMGNTAAAARLDGSLAKAAAALAEWHFFKANESWGRSEEAAAGHDIEMAADYLQNAANSAHYQFGADTEEMLTKIYDHGKLTFESSAVTHDALAMHLKGVEKALQDVAGHLKIGTKPLASANK